MKLLRLVSIQARPNTERPTEQIIMMRTPFAVHSKNYYTQNAQKRQMQKWVMFEGVLCVYVNANYASGNSQPSLVSMMFSPPLLYSMSNRRWCCCTQIYKYGLHSYTMHRILHFISISIILNCNSVLEQAVMANSNQIQFS